MDLNRLRPWRIILVVLGLLALFAAWLLGHGGWLIFLAGGLGICAGEIRWRFFRDHGASPYPWMLLAPLLLRHYSSVADFRIRLACFLMLVYVLALALRRADSRGKFSLNHVKTWRIGCLAFLVFALTATVFYARGVHLSGDEPHYLMVAQSLVEDGDFDLRNNMQDKTYLAYLPVEVRFHGMVRDGKYRTFHLPGLSFLLLPFYSLFKLLGGAVPANLFFRLCAALIHAFFACAFFLVLRRAWPGKDPSAPFLFFLATFPLVFHAVHLFPELPAATLLIFAYLLSRGPQQKSSDPAGRGSDLSVPKEKRFFLAGLLLAGIPWLHFKYMVPMLVLVFFIMAGIWRDGGRLRDRLRALSFLLLPQAIGAALLSWYSKILYGSFDPTVISPEKNFLAIPLAGKVETLLSFFLDQRDGLLVYAPVFMLLFLVFRKGTRRSIRDFPLLAAMFLSYILFHASTTVRGGYSPAARPTLFVFWIMAVFLVAHYRQAGATGKALFRFLAGLTCFASAWLFYYPFFLYQPVTRDVAERASSLLLFLGSSSLNLSSAFPSFLKKPNAAYLPNWIWLGCLALGLILYYAHLARRLPARIIFPAWGLALLFFLCFVPHVQLRTRYTAAKLAFYNSSRNFTFHPESGRFKVLAGQDYDLFFDLDVSAAERLSLRLLNPNRVALRVTNGRRTLLAGSRAAENRIDVSLRRMNGFSLGKRNLVHVGLEAKTVPGTVFFWLEFR